CRGGGHRQLCLPVRPEVLITRSCSKNFGLYRDRVGALIVYAQNAEKLTAQRSQLAFLARNHSSTPPAQGPEVVAALR
ncbi:aminotransferase class I/II-fold pyridoxal phosphate-dependent enzyme, partial [Pseudomonas aeruginosa]